MRNTHFQLPIVLAVIALGVLAACHDAGSGHHADAGSDTDGGHVHGDDLDAGAGDGHALRDVDAMLCDAGNWRQLLPDLRLCQLPGAVLDGEDLRRANLDGANLADARLAGADLFKATLVAADLSRARLAGAKLTGASLAGATLTDADLTAAVLTGASLAGAKLAGANLTDANLLGANLAGADFTGATLLRAATDNTTICPSGKPGPCW